ncbi:hypothetical protein MKY84_04975 [Chryseomicrobium sp. FSL W7-1435]|uniref:hypothetical protein n=1 Tax=Chryseomicrobium sp. FSL W7-1435 TaxID=2921704 RepID=UPI00315AA212
MSKDESNSPDYMQYFKNKEEHDKIIHFVVDNKQQENTLKLLKILPLTSNSKLVFTDETRGVIELKDYTLHFAVIPNGDFVYYTKNKKTGRNANYSRAVLDRVIFQYLQKWGAITSGESYLEFLTNRLIETISIENSTIQFDLDYLTLDIGLSMNLEFDVLEGAATIECFLKESWDNDPQKEIDEPVEVGSLYFKIYNSSEYSQYYLWHAADASSGDDHVLMSNFIDEYEKEIQWGIKFLTLGRIQIDKEYRRAGLGKQALSELKNSAPF